MLHRDVVCAKFLTNEIANIKHEHQTRFPNLDSKPKYLIREFALSDILELILFYGRVMLEGWMDVK